MIKTLALAQIQSWLQAHQKRLQYGDLVIPISAIATKAGISRQTLYAVLNGERDEFGQAAQIRLSRVIQEITSHPDYQVSKMIRLDLSRVVPRIRFGV
jgi:DNA invertase Pin-like site-specific DNA recombinase